MPNDTPELQRAAFTTRACAILGGRFWPISSECQPLRAAAALVALRVLAFAMRPCRGPQCGPERPILRVDDFALRLDHLPQCAGR